MVANECDDVKVNGVRKEEGGGSWVWSRGVFGLADVFYGPFGTTFEHGYLHAAFISSMT